jgi:hypothetical protein
MTLSELDSRFDPTPVMRGSGFPHRKLSHCLISPEEQVSADEVEHSDGYHSVHCAACRQVTLG